VDPLLLILPMSFTAVLVGTASTDSLTRVGLLGYRFALLLMAAVCVGLYLIFKRRS
jgi:hypothetical protein